jgi:acyl-coenzyme A synthetase/AMP-(fatty) acid ligase
VELEEVETALKSCPGIAEAAVLLADDRDEAVLVAFLSHKAPWGYHWDEHMYICIIHIHII